MVLLAPFISLSHLLSPLVLVSENSFLHLHTSGISRWAIIYFNTIVLHITSLLDSMGHFNALLIALKEVVAIVFIECAKSIHDLILARKINLFERFLHL